MTAKDQELIAASQIDELLDLLPGEWASYVNRRQAPAPATRILGRPAWLRGDVERWHRRLIAQHVGWPPRR